MTLPALFGVNEVETRQLAGTKPAGCRGSIVHCNMLCNKGTPLPFEGSASCMLVLSGVRVCVLVRVQRRSNIDVVIALGAALDQWRRLCQTAERR